MLFRSPYLARLVAIAEAYEAMTAGRPYPVSYTHLDVYKRQNIACILLTQGIAQLSDRYPQKEWEEIISNCSVQLLSLIHI